MPETETETRQAPKRRRAALGYIAILLGSALLLVAISLLARQAAPQTELSQPAVAAAPAQNGTNS